MKRILLLTASMGLLSLCLLMGTPGETHKIDWCHFPPGGWTGDPATSHALILSIDIAADGTPTGGQHLNHQGDGPLSVLGANCGGRTCPSSTVFSSTAIPPGAGTNCTTSD